MLDEARDNNKENDAENMRRTCKRCILFHGSQADDSQEPL